MAQSTPIDDTRVGNASAGGLGAIDRLDPNHLGVLLFIMSEALFFVALIITYVVYRGQSTSGPTAATALDVRTAAIFTVFLLASSVSMGFATGRLGRNEIGGLRRWLVVTILLGTVFLGGQGSEYVRLYREGVTVSGNLWGSTFFTLTGFHALHVLIGLVALESVALSVRPGERHVRGASAVEAVALYWHFVDAVWIVVFSVVYLWSLIS
jgi:heme/copper-type cytochrome/quinol oxidase subunit 3